MLCARVRKPLGRGLRLDEDELHEDPSDWRRFFALTEAISHSYWSCTTLAISRVLQVWSAAPSDSMRGVCLQPGRREAVRQCARVSPLGNRHSFSK